MKKLYGVTTAMVTPFLDTDEIDLAAVERLADFLIQKGVNCLYPLGTTGEMLRLSLEERKRIAERVVDTNRGRIAVFIHCGASTLNETLTLVEHAQAIGADGAGVVTPQFFSLNEREMINYYNTICTSSPDFPIYLYNIPQCASNDLTVEATREIAQANPNARGIKYSFADMSRTLEYLDINGGGFSVLHGADHLFLPVLSMGCDGTVSGISGVYPEPFVNIYKAWQVGDWPEALRQQKVANRFIKALGAGRNMAYFKTALERRKICGQEMRAPQLKLTRVEKENLIEELRKIEEETGYEI